MSQIAERSIGQVLEQFHQHRDLMLQELRKIIIGQEEVLEQIFAAVFTRGHCLLVGVPGLAKTLMVSSIARILDITFKRIQFTPDLMPSDITGTNVLDESETGRRDFRFVAGPIFANIILADEINRTPPKTQAALLQAMQEREVTVGQTTYPLPDPFFVIATQNPIEQEGTYPLPEAQLDRFMLELRLGYPSRVEEESIVTQTTGVREATVSPVLDGPTLAAMQSLVRRIPVSESLISAAVLLARMTRPNEAEATPLIREFVEWGAGPRASQYLVLGAKARAAMDGRPQADLDDVRAVAPAVLRHRVMTNFAAEAADRTSEDVVQELVGEGGWRDRSD